ncbi:MAG: ribosome biogenesis GTPase YlqF [Halanaerobiales bacterium]|nr:ribosome biogenesis GTPase YlqF [Halanaerobiales bacterium]
MNIYPGHMAKAKRVLKENLKNVDLVLEVLDARIVKSSHNKELKEITEDKEKILILNKKDLAEKNITDQWVSEIEKYVKAIKMNAVKKSGMKNLINLMEKKQEEINEKRLNKGINQRPIRAIVIGIPNVGKSAIINALTGKSSARTGNTPGVTRGKQWIKVSKNIELLDMPGILFPKADNEETAYKLVLTGAIELKKVDTELAAYKLLKFLDQLKKIDAISEYYEIDIYEGEHPYDILPKIGKKRGCLMSGGKIDRNRAAKHLVNDYKKGVLGRLSLEITGSDHFEF